VETAGATFGRGMAAIVTTTFGFIWIGLGLSVLPSVPAAIWVTYSLATVVLLTLAVTAMRQGRKLMAAQATSRGDAWQARRNGFRLVTTIEVIGCIAVVVLADVARRPTWIPVGVSLVVGLHFLPLGKVLGITQYYWVGALIVLCDILVITASRSVNLVAAVGTSTGVILWGSAIYALIRSLRVVPSQRSS